MLLFECSPTDVRFTTVTIHFLILSLPFQARQLPSVSRWASCYTVFFSSLARYSYFFHFLFFYFLFLYFILFSLLRFFRFLFFISPWYTRTSKSTRQDIFLLLLLLIVTWSGVLRKIQWSLSTSTSLIILFFSFSGTDFGLWIYHLVVWSIFSLLKNYKQTNFPTKLCQV